MTGRGAPEDLALARARSKAHGARDFAAGDRSGVLGVDTVVAIGERELRKPKDRDEARATLRALATAREHAVLTAHVLVDGAGVERVELARATVACRALDEREIEAYLDLDEWADKAGGYGIQAAAGAFMTLREGSFDTVVGLSVEAVRRLLNAWESSCDPAD